MSNYLSGKNRSYFPKFILWGLMIFLVACGQTAPVPTPLPVAELPTALPTIPADELPPTQTAQPVPTATPQATPLPVSTADEPTGINNGAEPVVVLSISQPVDFADLLANTSVIAAGSVQLPPEQFVITTLSTRNGITLTQTTAVTADGLWQAQLPIPQNVTGSGWLQASIVTADGETVARKQVDVNLLLNIPENEQYPRYLELYRPVRGTTAVAGYNFFFDGWAQRPWGNAVTISVLADNCRRQVARQRFVLRGSGYWQGFTILPPDTPPGPGCAIAQFSEAGEEEWRTVQIPITILANDDPAANGVIIGNPPPNSDIVAGNQLLLYGTAFVSNRPVAVSVVLENGRILTEESPDTDNWGYWELPFSIPVDVFGPAQITVSTGQPDSDNFVETQTFLNIIEAEE